MKILVVTQYFYPETFRINSLCIELVNRGYDVDVLTGYPQYPQGKIYDGYGYDIDYEKIIKLYDNFISTAQKKCKDCWAVGLCGRCFDSINEKCDSLLNQLENNYIYYIENIQDDKKLFDKLKTIDIEL